MKTLFTMIALLAGLTAYAEEGKPLKVNPCPPMVKSKAAKKSDKTDEGKAKEDKKPTSDSAG